MGAQSRSPRAGCQLQNPSDLSEVQGMGRPIYLLQELCDRQAQDPPVPAIRPFTSNSESTEQLAEYVCNWRVIHLVNPLTCDERNQNRGASGLQSIDAFPDGADIFRCITANHNDLLQIRIWERM